MFRGPNNTAGPNRIHCAYRSIYTKISRHGTESTGAGCSAPTILRRGCESLLGVRRIFGKSLESVSRWLQALQQIGTIDLESFKLM